MTAPSQRSVKLIHGSEYNSVPEVVQEMAFAPDVFIVDSTLRSLQSAVSGSRHSLRDLVTIGVALDRLGVRELIVNLTWKDGLAVCEKLAEQDLEAKLVGTFRARHPRAEEWIRAGAAAGVHEVCLESCQNADHLRRLADIALSRGCLVSHAFAEPYTYDEVVALCRAGQGMGLQSQSFHDSFFRFGLTPEGARYFYRAVQRDVSACPPLYIHLSNFYGHAVMTAAAAITAGASAADASINGIGHHAGHISLAEIVLVLEVLYGIRTGIRLELLKETALLVRDLTGCPLASGSPIVGDLAFALDGAYWAAEAHVPSAGRVHAAFPICPEAVGNSQRIVWSDRTVTPAAVRTKLARMGVVDEVDDNLVGAVIGLLTRKLEHAAYPRWLEDAEFEALCREVVNEQRRLPASDRGRSASSNQL